MNVMKLDDPVASAAIEVEPLAVMPVQFHGRPLDVALQPEKRLMLAVLEDAVVTFQKHATATTRGNRTLFEETEAWLDSDDASWPFSFRNICEALDLDEHALRDGLHRWRDRRRAGIGPDVVRSPFRRIGGSRHKATGRAPGLRHLRVA